MGMANNNWASGPGRRQKILVVIPAYNEEATILSVIEAVRAVQIPLDILVVNDASTDKTANLVRSQDVILLDLPINLGIGGAMQTGFLYAVKRAYDIVVQVDGDGQHDPAYIPQFIQKLDDGADIAIGSRFCDQSHRSFRSTFLRRIGIRFFRGIIYLFSNQRISDPTSGFRALNRNAFELFARSYPQEYPEPESLLLAFGHALSVREIPVVMFCRQQGASSITALKSIYYMIRVTLGMLVFASHLRNRLK